MEVYYICRNKLREKFRREDMEEHFYALRIYVK